MQKFIAGNHWLEPIWPSPGFPASILRTAETLSFRAGKLTGLLPDITSARIGGLMRITNSYYSNLIEGQYTEPATLSALVRADDIPGSSSAFLLSLETESPITAQTPPATPDPHCAPGHP
ncbi:hypothetical protein [Pseudomonas marginalis]|uniref:hypothetical protein n=1 Tax=Pseudomonas fluorescens group TaxID=136843 RepID=UPI001F439693|nr:hypothetical protein [Pseudomonas marginalis]